MNVIIFFEGGGDRRSRLAVRKAWHILFQRAGFQRKPGVRDCGPRGKAFSNFKSAHTTGCGGAYPMLLVDSESSVRDKAKPWVHLKECDGWDRPAGVQDDQAQLMIQCMETWIVADRKAIKEFFGQRLQENSLPSQHELESCDKKDIQEALETATRNCGKDREYKKGKRSFELLGRLDPGVLKKHLPHVEAFFQVLERKLNPDG